MRLPESQAIRHGRGPPIVIFFLVRVMLALEEGLPGSVGESGNRPWSREAVCSASDSSVWA